MFAVSLDDVLAEWGVAPADLDDVEGRVPAQLEMDLFDRLAERAGEPALGIKLASIPTATFDVVDYVAMHSPDLGSAYANVIRYQRLLHDGVGWELVAGGDQARLIHHPTPGVRLSRHAIEASLGLFVSRGRALVGADWVPRAVALCTPPPADDGVYRALFRCPVEFAQPVTEVILDGELLRRPVRQADAALFRILERTAAERLARLKTTSDFVDEVRREIGRLLRGELPRVAEVARRLGCSQRTLHHRLRAEGCAFGQLVDEARLHVAMAFLDDPGVKMADIALLLGFSDASAFHRAFRRWTGTTPIEYRRRQKPAAPTRNSPA